MQQSHVIERAREKAQDAAEKTGEVISRGLTEGWGKAKCYGKELKKGLSRVHRRIERDARALMQKQTNKLLNRIEKLKNEHT